MATQSFKVQYIMSNYRIDDFYDPKPKNIMTVLF